MALKDKIGDILQHIDKHRGTLEYNTRLYLSYEGQIKSEIEASMRQEILSPAALRRALQRIPSINILQKAIDKVSTVYAEPVKRDTNNKNDQEILNNIVKLTQADSVLISADRMANMQKIAAIEPYIEDGEPRLRVYGGHQFLPYSDDPVNPLKMTVFIKLLGTKTMRVQQDYVNGKTGEKTKKAEETVFEVEMYALYSDEEVLIIDQTGKILVDEMTKRGINGVNEFGTIPQVVINKSNFELVPFPDTAGLDTAVLIPKLLADLNYAVQFMSHSIIWAKNTDLGNVEINPDVIISLGEGSIEGKDPAIGTITPSVDIQGVLQLIEFELNGYFSSIGIKTTSLNGLKPGREVSGIAKAIDEGDTSIVRKKNMEFFKMVEHRLWKKMQKIQEVWAEQGLLNSETRVFSKEFVNNLSITFSEIKLIETINDKVAKIKLQDELGVITKRDIIKEFNPDFSDVQIEERLKLAQAEAEERAQKEMDRMMAAMPEEQPENNGAGEGDI